MTCAVVGTNQVRITIDSKAFTNGITGGSIFQFSVSGIKNARSTEPTGLFYFASYDSDMMRIDQSTS